MREWGTGNTKISKNPDFIGSGARKITMLWYLRVFAGTVRVIRNLAQARVGRTIYKRGGESADPSASHGVRETG